MVLGLKSDIFDRDASDVAPGAILFALEDFGMILCMQLVRCLEKQTSAGGGDARVSLKSEKKKHHMDRIKHQIPD